MTFRFTALLPNGSRTSGVIVSTSQAQVAAELQTRGWYPTRIEPMAKYRNPKRTLPINDIAIGLRILANLLESGLPVNRTLAAFAELAPLTWHPGLISMREAIRDGKAFATALAHAPIEVPGVVIGILQAGENSTGLAPAVRRAAELMEQTAMTRSAIRNALMYPLVLAIAGTISLTLLVGVVLPRFAAILADLGQTLPRTTRIVLQGATIARVLAFPFAVGTCTIAVVWHFGMRDRGRLRWYRWLLRLPFIGDVRRSAATARTSAALASLLESGVSVATALAHGARAAGDVAIEHAVLHARDLVIRGERLSVAVEVAGATTPTTVRLIRAGEESGRLAAMLTHATTIEQAHAEQRVHTLIQLLEPGLILLFGGVVAFVAAALLQAVYTIRPTG